MATSPTSGPGGGGDSTGLTLVTTELTDAQVKALPAAGANGLTLVAAQGVGTLILPVSGAVVKYGAVYTNVNAAALMVLGHKGLNETDLTPELGIGSSGLLDTALDEIGLFPLTGWDILTGAPPQTLFPAGAPSPLSSMENTDLIIYADNGGSGNFTGGGAGNSVVVHLLYVVLSV